MIKIIFSIIVENSIAISQAFFKPLVYLRAGVDSGTILRIVKPLDKLRITQASRYSTVNFIEDLATHVSQQDQYQNGQIQTHEKGGIYSTTLREAESDSEVSDLQSVASPLWCAESGDYCRYEAWEPTRSNSGTSGNGSLPTLLIYIQKILVKLRVENGWDIVLLYVPIDGGMRKVVMEDIDGK